jgi:hypothetical protein
MRTVENTCGANENRATFTHEDQARQGAALGAAGMS